MTWSRKVLLWELNEAYALGNPEEYRNLEGSMWPRLYHDETGNHYILEEYSGSQSVFDDQGLMITDKQGNASKTYTWPEDYPVLTGITLPNGGNRIIEPAVLKYLLNELDSDEDNPVNYPLDSNSDGLESMVTYEDGREEKHVTGRGWKQRYENGKLRQKTYFADRGKNRLPIRIQEGDHEEETSVIHYNEDLQVTKITGGKFTDTLWQPVDTDTNAYYVKASEAHTIDKKDFTIDYNDNRQVSRIRTRGLDNSFSYDADKNLIQVLDTIRNKATKYYYNTSNDLIKSEYPNGKINEFVYDAHGLLSEVKNNDGTKITVSRNSRGEIVSITDEENRTVHIERDIMGRVIKEISPGGRSVNYVWGGSGCSVCAGSELKLTKIIDSGNKQWEFKYDIMGNAIEMIYPDGTKLEQEFDMANRLIRFRNKRGQDITYEYDDDGRLTNKTTPEGTTTFAYDDRDRITSIQAPGFHYTYDYGTCYVAGAGSDFTLVKETNLTNGLWTEHIFNRTVCLCSTLTTASGPKVTGTTSPQAVERPSVLPPCRKVKKVPGQ